jgi:photosystem II stability/assembly factor-like uncharacterized protein
VTGALKDPVFGLAAGPLANDQMAVFAASQGGVYRSLDRGGTWAHMWTEGIAASIAVSPDFIINKLVVAGVEGGVIRSIDGGSSWQFHAIGALQALVGALSITPDLILAGTVDDGLYRSADRGLTWLPSNTGAYIPRIIAVHAGIGKSCLAGTDGGLFASSDGGRTWDDCIGDGIDDAVSSVTGDHDVTVMGTESEGILAWDTRHRTWQRLPETAPHQEAIALAILGEQTAHKEIVAITNTLIQRYRLEIGERGTAIDLVATTPLPFQAVCASIVHIDAGPHALIGSVDGDIVLVPFNSSPR